MAIELDDPNREDRSQMLEVIREFCTREAVRDRRDFQELAAVVAPVRFDQDDRAEDGDAREEIERFQYETAVAMLVEMAAPSARQSFDECLASINQSLRASEDSLFRGPNRTGIQSIEIVDPDGDQSYDLKESLPRGGRLSKEERDVVVWFRQQLPRDEFDPERWVEDQEA